MYTRQSLEAYGELIVNTNDQRIFKDAIRNMAFDEHGNCVAREVEIHLAAVPHLRADFQERYLQFMDSDVFFERD